MILKGELAHQQVILATNSAVATRGIDHFIWKLLKSTSAITSSPYPNLHRQLHGHQWRLHEQSCVKQVIDYFSLWLISSEYEWNLDHMSSTEKMLWITSLACSFVVCEVPVYQKLSTLSKSVSPGHSHILVSIEEHGT